jgi:hypothetical protein
MFLYPWGLKEGSVSSHNAIGNRLISSIFLQKERKENHACRPEKRGREKRERKEGEKRGREKRERKEGEKRGREKRERVKEKLVIILHSLFAL